ncbi:T9SS type A sorting domain-containing protein [Ignavibacterium sp.]|uniref:T9SS type A sorting domain-containing protein n=1 Tax=Ignavibacterium sp. TaxID=2651167 RepID=UPI0025C1D3B8|nr:T9SS type A sorting domain-containing protein [Ignavibacterium sp.]
MQKKLFLIFSFALLWSIVSVLAQDNSKEIARDRNFTEPQKLEYQTIPLENSEDILFDNGPLVTLPGGGCSNGDASILDGTLGLTVYGFGAQHSSGNYIADDFTNTSAWNIDSLKFFTYQTAATTVTINGIYVQIWNGQPNAGGTVIWGDLTTNRLSAARFTNIYRALNTTPTDCNRRIQEVVVNVGGLNLAPGTYWVQWGFTGTSTSGPWQPPITISGQTNTGNALQNLAGTWQNLVDGSYPQGAPFIVYGTSGPPCPVGAPSNPNPSDGATGISINPGNVTWTNGAGTTQVEVWFGPVGNLTQVYTGPAITSFSIAGPLMYNTTYGWKVVDKNDTCGVTGPTWTFTTQQDPNLWCFFDNFENGTGNWTITNDGGTPGCVWTIYTPPYPNAYTIPNSSGGVFAADVDECGSGSTLLSTATVTNPFDFSIYQTVIIEFDQDFNALTTNDACYVEVSTDGTNWTTVWQRVGTDLRNTHETINVSSLGALQSTFYVRLRSVQPGWDWWWAIDNFKVCATDPIPVELTSFVASVSGNNVNLNWSTATETNNQGFEIQRSNGGEYQVVGYVAGHGTTVEPQSYSFIDQNVGTGKYQYRLKQIDYDGKFEYSSVVEVEIVGPKEFSLAQNYPNPFNPSTTIDFTLEVDSRVTLKIFDVLGQEVMTLINGNYTSGSHKVNFDASGLNSGVYVYRIDAVGIDGKTFSSTMKMILNK